MSEGIKQEILEQLSYLQRESGLTWQFFLLEVLSVVGEALVNKVRWEIDPEGGFR